VWLSESYKAREEAKNENTDDPEPKAVHEDSLSLNFATTFFFIPGKTACQFGGVYRSAR
jgi:hypothetical protein